MRIPLLLLVLVAACSKDSSGPKGLDPIVSFNNAGPYQPIQGADVTFIWWDQSGQVSKTVIPWGTSACIKFTATRLADSVRFEYFMGDTTQGVGGTPWYKEWSPWFDPTTGIPTAAASEYPFGAEYWWFDYTKNPYAGTLATAPC